MKMLQLMDREYASGQKATYRQTFAQTPYHEDHVSTRELSIARSLGKVREREQQWAEQRRRENAEVKVATRESYRHDLYHLDKMYSKQFKELRVIPVTNRQQTEQPFHKLPFI
jgi:hypothetical protein